MQADQEVQYSLSFLNLCIKDETKRSCVDLYKEGLLKKNNLRNFTNLDASILLTNA